MKKLITFIILIFSFYSNSFAEEKQKIEKKESWCENLVENPKWKNNFYGGCVKLKKDITVYDIPFFLMINDSRLWVSPKSNMQQEYDFVKQQINDLIKNATKYNLSKENQVLLILRSTYSFLEEDHGFKYYQIIFKTENNVEQIGWLVDYYIYDQFFNNLYNAEENKIKNELDKKYSKVTNHLLENKKLLQQYRIEYKYLTANLFYDFDGYFKPIK